MTFNRKSKRFDDFILMLNDKFFAMSKYCSNNILSLQFFSNKVGEPIDVDSPMGINFSGEGDFSPRNRQIEIPFRINMCFKTKAIRQMPEGFPYLILEYAWESCTIFFCGKPSMGFPIMIVTKKSFAGFSKSNNSWTIMSLENSFLPERIEAFDSGVSSRLSLRDKDQMNSKKQMQSNKLRDTELISPSACGSHFIIHLGYMRNAQISPSFNQMPAQRKGLFICVLACKSRMPGHINCVKRIEADNSVKSSEMPGSHKVCLLQIAHPFSIDIWIRLIAVVSFWFSFLRLAMTEKYSGYSRNRRDMLMSSSFKLPVNGLCSDSGESRSVSFMRLQFMPDREDFLNHVLRSASSDFLWSTALVSETSKALFLISSKPFGKPTLGSLYSSQYFIEANTVVVQLNRFIAYTIFILILHRLFLPPKCFGRSLSDVKKGSRCYDIFKVHDVMS